MSKPLNTLDTLTEQIAELQERGYTYDFALQENGLVCKSLDRSFRPNQFTIVETHRFEGMSNPSDNSVLYAIQSTDGIKGTLVDAYGAYTDPLSAEMIKKLQVEYKN